MSLKTIAEGFGNLIAGNEKEIAHFRKKICDACPVSEFGKSKFCKLRNGGCGCYLPAKRSVPSEACPIGKWKAIE